MKLELLEPPSPRSKTRGSHSSDQTAVPKAVGLWESPTLEEEPSSQAVGTESYILALTPYSIPGLRHRERPGQ